MKPNYDSSKCFSYSTCTYTSNSESEYSIQKLAVKTRPGKIVSPKEKRHLGMRETPREIYYGCKHELASYHQCGRNSRNNRPDEVSSSAFLDLVNLVNKDTIGTKKLLDQKSSYSCSTIRHVRSKHGYKLYDISHHRLFQPLGLSGDECTISSSNNKKTYRKKLKRNRRRLVANHDTKYIHSAPCTCTSKSYSESRQSQSLKRKLKSKDNTFNIYRVENVKKLQYDNCASVLDESKTTHEQSNDMYSTSPIESNKNVPKFKNNTDSNMQVFLNENQDSTFFSSFNKLNVADMLKRQQKIPPNISEKYVSNIECFVSNNENCNLNENATSKLLNSDIATAPTAITANKCPKTTSVCVLNESGVKSTLEEVDKVQIGDSSEIKQNNHDTQKSNYHQTTQESALDENVASRNRKPGHNSKQKTKKRHFPKSLSYNNVLLKDLKKIIKHGKTPKPKTISINEPVLLLPYKCYPVCSIPNNYKNIEYEKCDRYQRRKHSAYSLKESKKRETPSLISVKKKTNYSSRKLKTNLCDEENLTKRLLYTESTRNAYLRNNKDACQGKPLKYDASECQSEHTNPPKKISNDNSKPLSKKVLWRVWSVLKMVNIGKEQERSSNLQELSAPVRHINKQHPMKKNILKSKENIAIDQIKTNDKTKYHTNNGEIAASGYNAKKHVNIDKLNRPDTRNIQSNAITNALKHFINTFKQITNKKSESILDPHSNENKVRSILNEKQKDILQLPKPTMTSVALDCGISNHTRQLNKRASQNFHYDLNNRLSKKYCIEPINIKKRTKEARVVSNQDDLKDVIKAEIKKSKKIRNESIAILTYGSNHLDSYHINKKSNIEQKRLSQKYQNVIPSMELIHKMDDQDLFDHLVSPSKQYSCKIKMDSERQHPNQYRLKNPHKRTRLRKNIPSGIEIPVNYSSSCIITKNKTDKRTKRNRIPDVIEVESLDIGFIPDEREINRKYIKNKPKSMVTVVERIKRHSSLHQQIVKNTGNISCLESSKRESKTKKFKVYNVETPNLKTLKSNRVIFKKHFPTVQDVSEENVVRKRVQRNKSSKTFGKNLYYNTVGYTKSVPLGYICEEKNADGNYSPKSPFKREYIKSFSYTDSIKEDKFHDFLQSQYTEAYLNKRYLSDKKAKVIIKRTSKPTLLSQKNNAMRNLYSVNSQPIDSYQTKWSSLTGIAPYLKRCFYTLRVNTDELCSALPPKVVIVKGGFRPANQIDAGAGKPSEKDTKKKKNAKVETEKKKKKKDPKSDAKSKKSPKGDDTKGKKKPESDGKGTKGDDTKGKKKPESDGKGKDKKKIKDEKKETKPKNVKTVSLKPEERKCFDPHECYPGICDPEPELCTPRICFKKMHKRAVQEKAIGPEKAKTSTNYTTTRTMVCPPPKICQPKLLKYKNAGSGKDKESYVVKQPRFHKSLNNPFRQAVRISSSFSFNIEFYKDKLPAQLLKEIQESMPPPKPLPRPPPPKKSHVVCKNCQSPKLWNKDVCGQGLCLEINRPIQTKIVYQPFKEVGLVTKRCFCTKEIAAAEKGTFTNKQTTPDLVNVGTVTKKCKPGQCDPGVCVPGKCDPNKCLERIKAKTKDFYGDKATKICQVGKDKKAIAEASGRAPPPPPLPIKHRNRQSVQLGSKFKFDVEFFKDRVTASSKNAEKERPPEKVEEEREKEKKPNKKVDKGTRGTDVRKGTKSKALETSPLLKRCFCTLKLQRPQIVNYLSVPEPQLLSKNKQSHMFKIKDVKNIVQPQQPTFNNVFTVGRATVEHDNLKQQPIRSKSKNKNQIVDIPMETIYQYIPKKFHKNISNTLLFAQSNVFGNDFVYQPHFEEKLQNYDRRPRKKRRVHFKKSDITHKKVKMLEHRQASIRKNIQKGNGGTKNFNALFGKLAQVFKKHNSETVEKKVTRHKTQKVIKNNKNEVVRDIVADKKIKHPIKTGKSERRTKSKAILSSKKAESMRMIKDVDTNIKSIDKLFHRRYLSADKLNKSTKLPFKHETVCCSYLRADYNNNKIFKSTLSPFASRRPLLVYPLSSCQNPDICRTSRDIACPCWQKQMEQKGSVKKKIDECEEDEEKKKQEEYNKAHPPLFEMKLQASDLSLLNTGEIFDQVYKLKTKHDQQARISKKMLERLHGKGCKCCVCQSLKLKEKLAKEQLEREGQNLLQPQGLGGLFSKGKKPCICGSKPCALQSERDYREKELEKDHKEIPCVCGTKICEKESVKYALKKKDLSRKDKKRMKAREKKRLEKKKAVKKEVKKKQQKAKYQVTMKKRANETARQVKQAEKLNKLIEQQMRKEKSKNDCMLVFDSVLDISKLGLYSAYRSVRCVLFSIVRGVRNPKAYGKSVLSAAKEPKSLLKNINIGAKATFKRIGFRFKNMKISKWVARKFLGTGCGNYLATALNPDPRARYKKLKPKKKKRRPKMPVDFECSIYMASLRKKPYWWLWFTCPRFYPHIISMFKILRYFADVMLFLLAVIVWSPCILCMECCRAVMCCTMCTG